MDNTMQGASTASTIHANELQRISSFSSSLNQFRDYSVLALVRDGFYQTQNKSEIKCYSCGFTFKFTDAIGDPRASHRRESPLCSHIRLQSAYSSGPSIGEGNSLSRPLNSHNTLVSPRRTEPLLNSTPQYVSLHQGAVNRTAYASNIEQSNSEQQITSRPHTNSELSDHVSSNRTDARFAANVIGASRAPNETSNNAQLLSDFRLEYCRKESFSGWPSNAGVSPGDLANAGFYYLGTDDKVQCAFCKGILRCWEPDDRPLAEHLRHFPTCEFLLDPQSVGNVPLGEEDRSMLATIQMRNSSGNSDALSGIMMDRPVNPRYANVGQRISSFSNFPSNSFQTPAALAHAGFFYTGQIDAVKCFFCNIVISNWKQNSDPWLEHAKASKKCGYILMNKGENYVKSVQQGKSKQQLVKRPKARSNNSKRRVDPKELDRLMNTQMVKSVMEIGNYSDDLMRKVIQNRLEELGDQYPNAEALADGISDYLEYMENETASDQDEIQDTFDSPKTYKEERNHSTSPVPDPEGIFESSKDSFVCKVCLDNTASIVFLKCGHLVCCNSCAPELTKCPICREKILGTISVDL